MKCPACGAERGEPEATPGEQFSALIASSLAPKNLTLDLTDDSTPPNTDTEITNG